MTPTTTSSETRAGKACRLDPLLPRAARIRKVIRETADTFTWWLEPTDGVREVRFAPGQFNMIYALGIGEVPISISGDPDQPSRTVHTIRAVGSVTNVMRGLEVGASVGFRGPYGTAWPEQEAKGRDVVLVAGGIGLAPLRPLIYRIMNHRDRFGRVVILYGARTPADMLYPGELETWRGRFDIDLRVTVDRADPDWRGPVGVVTRLLDGAVFDRAETVAMLCGPEIMMRYATRELMARGLSADRIHVSMERNMKCAVGFCGHCQYGPEFVCKDGPVFTYGRVERLLQVREV